MRDLDELSINSYPDAPRPAPTEEQFRRFAVAFDVDLPDRYADFLRHANGGHPELDSFVPVDADAADSWAVDHFYHLSEEEDSESLWVATRTWRPVLGNRAVPIASDGGGNQVFLDLDENPVMVKLAIAEGALSIRDVSRDFEQFLDLLHTNPDFI